MVVDGKQVAADIFARVRGEISGMARAPRLALLSCAPSFATKKFMEVKKRRAAEVGIAIVERELPANATTNDALHALGELAVEADGIVLQLPFPPALDLAALLAALPASHDVDALGASAAGGTILPPVVGALAELAARYGIEFPGAKAVVVGRGRLVGAPAAAWLARQGADVVICDRSEPDLASRTREADILVLGAGVPGLITPDMVKEGAAVFDAGTSEEAGKLAGDADPRVAERAGLFTPVPGGVGPITVAKLFENLAVLTARRGAEKLL